MATGLQVIGRFAPLLGLLPSTLERQLRAQRLAGQLPTGKPGGGRFSAHFGAGHLANVILGLAGPEPSDAPAAVEALRLMPFQPDFSTVPANMPQPLPTFEDQMAYGIGAMAEACRLGGMAHVGKAAAYRTIQLSLCLNPRQAVIAFGPPDPKQVVICYAIGDAPLELWRVTILRGSLLVAAGELLADTIEQTKAQPAKAGAEQVSAGNLRQEAPAPFGDQPRANGTDRSSNTPDGIHVDREFQARPVAPATTGSDEPCQTPMMLMT